MQIQTPAKDPIDMPACPEVWHDPSVGRLAAMKPREVDPVCSERLQGIVIGIVLAVVSLAAWYGLGQLVDALWPASCDGTSSAIRCVAMMLGGAS